MTGFLIVAGLVIILALALRPAHRRAHPAWRPGFETRNDRDLGRLREELRAVDQGPTVHAPRYPSVPFDPPGHRPTDTTLAA